MNKLFLLLIGALVTGFMASSAMAIRVEIGGVGVDDYDYSISHSCRHKRHGSKCTFVADEVRQYGRCEYGDGRRLECIVEYYHAPETESFIEPFGYHHEHWDDEHPHHHH